MESVLKELSFPKHVKRNFLREKVVVSTVPLLSDTNLVNLGVNSIGEQAVLREACRTFVSGSIVVNQVKRVMQPFLPVEQTSLAGPSRVVRPPVKGLPFQKRKRFKPSIKKDILHKKIVVFQYMGKNQLEFTSKDSDVLLKGFIEISLDLSEDDVSIDPLRRVGLETSTLTHWSHLRCAFCGKLRRVALPSSRDPSVTSNDSLLLTIKMATHHGGVENVEEETQALSWQYGLNLLSNALLKVMKGEEFDLATEKVQKSRMCAQKLYDWIMKNKEETGPFVVKLVDSLKECCGHSRPVKFHTIKERMWESYYKYRSSDDFKGMWVTFVERVVGIQPYAILYQFLTDEIMTSLMFDEFPVINEVEPLSVKSLDYYERNALRYTAGYVLRALVKKIRKSSHPIKTKLLVYLREIMEGVTDEECGELESEEWIKAIDRGGLVRVSDEIYLMFGAMELELRKHLKLGNDVNIKENGMREIMKNEEVLFYWSLVSASFDETEASELLIFVVQHWITVRGFSFVSGFMEKFKQQNKKSTQKSKGLRKTLNTTNTVTIDD